MAFAGQSQVSTWEGGEVSVKAVNIDRECAHICDRRIDVDGNLTINASEAKGSQVVGERCRRGDCSSDISLDLSIDLGCNEAYKRVDRLVE